MSETTTDTVEDKKQRDLVFTIGHSNMTVEEFLRILRRHDIDVLVDVRSVPRSKFASQFDRAALERACVEDAIGYVYGGDELGGRPKGEAYYDEEGHVLYWRVARETWFLDALGRFREKSREIRLAFMCTEEDPTGCHRRLLLGRVLVGQGVEVNHIRRDGRVQTESEIAATKAAVSTLFSDLEDRSWRSIRSVLHKERQKLSSKR